jgi:large subunit ribosomal protein L33
MPQEFIQFECTVCKNRNYTSMKNKKKNPDKLERKKFCRTCKKHTSHKEIK